MALEVMDLSPITLPLASNKSNKIELDKENFIRGQPRPFKGIVKWSKMAHSQIISGIGKEG